MNHQDHQGHQGREAAPIPAETDRAARALVDAALTVHRELGPGLLESVYEICLSDELTARGLAVERQVALPVRYKGRVLEAGFRIDLVVEKRVVAELKTVEALLPIHKAQPLTHMRLGGFRVGLLINFNSILIKHGIQRFAL